MALFVWHWWLTREPRAKIAKCGSSAIQSRSHQRHPQVPRDYRILDRDRGLTPPKHSSKERSLNCGRERLRIISVNFRKKIPLDQVKSRERSLFFTTRTSAKRPQHDRLWFYSHRGLQSEIVRKPCHIGQALLSGELWRVSRSWVRIQSEESQGLRPKASIQHLDQRR